MEYSFPRYLLAKQTVDDRALNRGVLDRLRRELPRRRRRITEIGAGMGNMLARLLSWGIISTADYLHEDSMPENLDFAAHWIPDWAARAGMHVTHAGAGRLRLFDSLSDVHVTLDSRDFESFVHSGPMPADLLIANAFLDLLPLRSSLPHVLSLTKDLAWLTINFDGLTAFEPAIDPILDDQIIRLYHRSMDTRPSGGDSRSGRHLVTELQQLGARILAAGSSDWVVYADQGKYPADEAYFLEFILHFFEQSLAGHRELDAKAFAAWLDARRAQIRRGELVYLAHQLDVLARVPDANSDSHSSGRG